jgi:hypothetical protein
VCVCGRGDLCMFSLTRLPLLRMVSSGGATGYAGYALAYPAIPCT